MSTRVRGARQPLFLTVLDDIDDLKDIIQRSRDLDQIFKSYCGEYSAAFLAGIRTPEDRLARLLQDTRPLLSNPKVPASEVEEEWRAGWRERLARADPKMWPALDVHGGIDQRIGTKGAKRHVAGFWAGRLPDREFQWALSTAGWLTAVTREFAYRAIGVFEATFGVRVPTGGLDDYDL